MARTSAGLLPYRSTAAGLEVFIAHLGGPFWAGRDERAWGLIKGEYDPGQESPRDVARREFAEEIGVAAPAEPWLDLGEIRQSGGKCVIAFAVECAELQFVASNEIEVEWPPRSGRKLLVPEVDRAQFWPLEAARFKLIASQAPLLDRLHDVLAD